MTEAVPQAKTQGLSPCAEIVRDHDHDRWLTLLFAAPHMREDLAALYAFAHEIGKTRERVSEPMMGEIRLQWWRESIEGIYDGLARKHPVVAGLADLVARHKPDRSVFIDLIDARAAELYDEGPVDFDGLLAYADQTGGALNRMAAFLCGAQDEAHLSAAHAVGRAWALTGILRALAFQAAMQRITLPKDALEEAGIAPESLYRGQFSPDMIPIIRRIANAAQEAIRKARTQNGSYPAQARSPMLLAVLARDYLDRLAHAGDDPFAAPFDRGALTRQLKLFWAVLRGRF
ncbi:phytoene synthase [Iodidimonas gelatinilytica]|uniref:Phytoene synthase n=1 Tax=Iodidimonas gelatinilytica TaxID=1236966 RepID=A0A5A7N1C1_9PROT|nr:phytoene/squalene synthase family protein [Iodidimonas gelatinilytica]GEQ98351.1 phytoene synthase [Iodidimonas gelatinilytica]GER02071.1 phytoene synthase [Iodidimonas gelatinilytica]